MPTCRQTNTQSVDHTHSPHTTSRHVLAAQTVLPVPFPPRLPLQAVELHVWDFLSIPSQLPEINSLMMASETQQGTLPMNKGYPWEYLAAMKPGNKKCGHFAVPFVLTSFVCVIDLSISSVGNVVRFCRHLENCHFNLGCCLHSVLSVHLV